MAEKKRPCLINMYKMHLPLAPKLQINVLKKCKEKLIVCDYVYDVNNRRKVFARAEKQGVPKNFWAQKQCIEEILIVPKNNTTDTF